MANEKTARLFDVRPIIGDLLVVYGLVAGAIGLFGPPHPSDRVQGMNISLLAGLAMLVLGGLLLVWQRLRPARRSRAGESRD